MRFDAYAASLKGHDPGYVCHVLAQAVGGIEVKGKPRRRYGVVRDIEASNGLAVWVGLDSASGAIYVEGKGEDSPKVAKALRSHFPDHTCPRLDVCEDYDEPGAFEALQSLVRAHKGPRVKGGYVALPDDVQDGKTWCAGVRGGVGYIRVYESGKHPDRLHLARPDMVRVEGEFRPHYAKDKIAAAKMQPLQAWGLAGWTHKVGEALTQTEIPRLQAEVRKYSYDKTTRYIANTFRRHLEEMLSNGEDISRTFQAVWEEEDQYRQR